MLTLAFHIGSDWLSKSSVAKKKKHLARVEWPPVTSQWYGRTRAQTNVRLDNDIMRSRPLWDLQGCTLNHIELSSITDLYHMVYMVMTV